MLIDLSGVPHHLRTAIDKVLREDEQRSLDAAIKRQREAAAEFHRLGKARAIDGLGPQTMHVDPVIAEHWRQRRGVDIWQDDDFCRWFRKMNPETRVESGGTRIQVGYRGLGESGRKRFHKSYG